MPGCLSGSLISSSKQTVRKRFEKVKNRNSSFHTAFSSIWPLTELTVKVSHYLFAWSGIKTIKKSLTVAPLPFKAVSLCYFAKSPSYDELCLSDFTVDSSNIDFYINPNWHQVEAHHRELDFLDTQKPPQQFLTKRVCWLGANVFISFILFHF